MRPALSKTGRRSAQPRDHRLAVADSSRVPADPCTGSERAAHGPDFCWESPFRVGRAVFARCAWPVRPWLSGVQDVESYVVLDALSGIGGGSDVEVAFSGLVGQVTQLSWEQAVSVRFEELAPVSAFPVVPGRRWGPGWWWSATTGRHVVHGSAAMRTQLMLLDRDPDVIGLAGRPVRFVWRDEADGRVRSWIPQVFARYTDGTGLFADCPSVPAAGGSRAQRARSELEAACARVGWEYRRLEPPPALVAANLRWLAGYRHPRHQGSAELRATLVEVFGVSRPLAEAAASAGDPLQVLPARLSRSVVRAVGDGTGRAAARWIAGPCPGGGDPSGGREPGVGMPGRR